MEFLSREFYDGKIKVYESVKNIMLVDFGVSEFEFGNFWDEVFKFENVLVFIDILKREDCFER